MCWAPKWPRRSPRDFWGAPLQLPRGPSGKSIRSIGGLLGGPGSAKVRQGFIFDGKTSGFLMISLFALSDLGSVPGSVKI